MHSIVIHFDNKTKLEATYQVVKNTKQLVARDWLVLILERIL